MRLKNYVFFRETDKGVWFDAGRRSFALNGKGIYPLVERLLTMLERSGRSPDEITDTLPEKLRPFAQRLFAELARHDMLHHGLLPASGAHAHTAAIEFLKYLEDRLDEPSSGARLASWHEATMVVAGDGYALKAAAGVLADSGCGRIRIHIGSTDDVGAQEIKQALSGRTGSEIAITSGPFEPAGGNYGIQGLVVAGDDASLLARAIDQAAWCQSADVAFTAGLPINGQLAALTIDGPDKPGLADLVDWLLPARDPVTPSPQCLAIAGSIAAQMMIDRFFGIDQATAPARLVSPFGDVTACPVPPSPRRHVTGAIMRPPDYSGRIELPQDRDLSAYEQLRMTLGPWTDPALAILGSALPEPLPQLPLYHEAIMVRRTGTGLDEASMVVGWGLGAEQAGMRASMKAIALLAEEEFGTDRHLVAGINERLWQAAAFASAFAHHDRFARDAIWAEVEAEDIRDASAQLLLGILRFQTPQPITMRIGAVPGIPAFVVACHAGGRRLSRLSHPSLEDAIGEAIGLAVSNLQLRSVDRTDHVDSPVTAGDDHDGVTITGWDAMASAFQTAERAISAQFIRSQRLGLPAGVFCGYACVEDGV